MNSLKIKFRLITAIIFHIISTSIAFSSVVVDFDLASNKSGQPCILVSAFHTQKQKLLHYETLPAHISKRPLKSFLSNYNPLSITDKELDFQIEFKPDGLRITKDLAPFIGIDDQQRLFLREDKSVSQESYIITSTFILFAPDANQAAFNQNLKKYVWSSRPITQKTPEELGLMIAGLIKKNPVAYDFPRLLYDSKKPHFLSSLNSQNKGHFGEWLTKITMFSFGYQFNPSIYSGNHGLDGIFLSSCRHYLIFSQSKLGDANPLARTVIKNELGEDKIYDRLDQMEIYGAPDVKKTRQMVLEFINHSPHNMYKLAHCTFSCGLSDLRVKPVNVLGFPRGKLRIHGASEAIKVEAVKTTLDSFVSDPLDQFKLALNAISPQKLPAEQSMRSLFTTLGISEARQNLMMEALLSEDSTEK